MTAARAIAAALCAAAAIVVVAALVFLAQRGVFARSHAADAAPTILTERPFTPDRPLRVLFLGASLTHGEPWPDAAARALSQCRRGEIVAQVVALPGAASFWGLEALGGALSGGAGDPPDIVVVEFSINDASLARGVSLNRSRDNHRRMVALIRAAGAIPVLATMSPAFGRNGWERPGLRAYEALYRALSAETGAGLIDVARLWRAMTAGALARLMPDGLHPTPEATLAVTAPAMAEALAPLVCSDGALGADRSRKRLSRLVT